MRRALLAGLFALVMGACAETQRCPDAEVFDENGRCGPIPDAGGDAGPDVIDAGTSDGG